MNKSIYMTYHKKVPDFVFHRWKTLNPEYSIDFSLDEDCIQFLRTHFNDSVAHLFIQIPKGMYKADLWRLCKLYIHGGVYADVDLIPYLNIDTVDKEVTFFSCLALDGRSIFQAFMLNPKPKSPILLQCLISFLTNHPYTYLNGPTFDMYNCLAYSFRERLLPDKIYKTDKVRISIVIGKSETNTKEVDLVWFPDVAHTFRLHGSHYPDTFVFMIKHNKLFVRRIDSNSGWGHSHSVDICIDCSETLLLCKEELTGQDNINCYVTLNKQKILDSRDPLYVDQKGW
jgi:hypothetical protein